VVGGREGDKLKTVEGDGSFKRKAEVEITELFQFKLLHVI